MSIIQELAERLKKIHNETGATARVVIEYGEAEGSREERKSIQEEPQISTGWVDRLTALSVDNRLPDKTHKWILGQLSAPTLTVEDARSIVNKIERRLAEDKQENLV